MVHSLVTKVSKLKNLELAWEKVKRNRGAGGVDGQSLDDFASDLEGDLKGLHEELRTGTCRPQPVKRQLITKSGQPGKFRPLARLSAPQVKKAESSGKLSAHFILTA